VCAGDAPLRKEVERLLAGEEAPLPFATLAEDLRGVHEQLHAGRLSATGLQLSATPAGGAAEFVDEASSRVGPYKLLQRIGEGGFGVVYMAEQETPVRRVVALKIIKLGMDTRQVVARFEAERQALAIMDHPHIAKVFDGGATATGRPYFVMELVKGVPITEFCDAQRLSTLERLELFTQVCQAVHHAHQKGIIHRDIKPRNVLVTLHDGKPAPKVIDFGIAKALDQRLTERTLFTEYGQFLGTPEYMSPEQAEMSGLDVDTRTDIYALGVLLYELLTGTTPLATGTLRNKSYAEIQRAIHQFQPVKPSTRLTTLHREPLVGAKSPKPGPWSRGRGSWRAGAAPIAENRRADPQTLRRQLSGDLDSITMKALEKERTRRYGSASELAADVRRYLIGQPIEAKRDRTWYVLRKTLVRHRVPLLTLLTFVLLLAGSSVGGWVLYGRSERFALAERKARETATELLWQSYLDQARLSRRSGRDGQRFKTLEILARAAAIRPSLELRNEAVACLALADARTDRPLFRAEPSVSSAFDRAFEYCALGGEDGSLSIVRVADGAEVGRWLSSQGGPLVGLTFSPDGRFLASDQRPGSERQLLKVWRISDGQSVLSVEVPAQSPATFCADGRQFAVAREGQGIAIYDLESGVLARTLPVSGEIDHFVFDSQDQRVAVRRANDVFADLLDGGSGAVLRSFEHPAAVASLAWSPDGAFLAVGAVDAHVYLWDAASGERVGVLSGHEAPVIHTVFSPTGASLASVSWDGTSRIWDLASGSALVRIQGSVASFGPQDRTIAQMLPVGRDHEPRVVELVPPQGFSRIVGREPGRASKRDGLIAPDGRVLLSGAWTGEGESNGLRVCDAAAGKQIARLPIGEVRGIVFEPAGRFFLTTGERGLFRWPYYRNGAEVTIGPPEFLGDYKGQVDLAADARTAALLGGFEKWTFTVMNIDDPQQARTVDCQFGAAYVQISHCGRWAAIGTWNGFSVEVRDLQTLERVFSTPSEASATVAFTPDDRWLIVSDTERLSFRRVGSWEIERTIPMIAVGAMSISPDGELLAITETRGAVRLIDLPSLRTLAVLEPPGTEWAGELAFSPDGTTLAVMTSGAHVVQLWDLRRLRGELAAIKLDWGLPPYPPSAADESPEPLRLQADLGPLAPDSSAATAAP